MAVTVLTSAAEVLLATNHEAYVRGRLSRPEVDGWTGHGATAWRFAYAGDPGPSVMTLGSPTAVALLLEELLPELRNNQPLTVPRGTPRLLPAWTALQGGVDWDFRWTEQAPPPQPREDDVVEVSHDEVRTLLQVANPDASTQPGDPRVRRWLGVRDGSSLVAAGADTSEVPGVGHLSSIGTHPDVRGQGLGAAVTAALIRRMLSDDCDVVTLGMYATNTAGRALYNRLGMHGGRDFTSGRLQIRSRW